MSDREFTRAAVLRRVIAEEITIQDATVVLGVSNRHARRLTADVARGAGRPWSTGVPAGAPIALPLPYRAQVLELVRVHYGGPAPRGPGQRFGPTLTAEHLWTDHGILVPVSTLARWMRAAQVWARVRRARPSHQRRARKAHVMERVQLDGSFHDWFEGRGARACVMTMVDDATGRTLLHFGAEEILWAAGGVLQAWIAAHGVPRALYTNRKNVYLRAPTTNELARGDAPLTHFGRICAKLGITLIGATSPQAKDRVERGHGHASGPLDQETPAARDPRSRRRECVRRSRVFSRAQCALCRLARERGRSASPAGSPPPARRGRLLPRDPPRRQPRLRGAVPPAEFPARAREPGAGPAEAARLGAGDRGRHDPHYRCRTRRE
ncbi:MAG TPA: hypothetical protein VHE78_16700 [Gemmatimonadaceae bacterium]|nr:hypothetical protein [Gemmatimonadaceae bacterium]